ncbi:hypothetical protein AOLI_G00270450 [Acnodon oligacanthus]
MQTFDAWEAGIQGQCFHSKQQTHLEKVRTALREEFQSTEDSPETSRDLTENLQDQIEAEAEAEAVKLLDEEEADNNHPLGDEMLEMMAMKGEAQVIKDLVLTDLQDLPTENLRDINFADTEAEAIKPQMQIDGDDPGTPNDQPLDAETDWLIDYEPIKNKRPILDQQTSKPTEEPIHSDAELMSMAREELPSAVRESPDSRGGMLHKLLHKTENV